MFHDLPLHTSISTGGKNWINMYFMLFSVIKVTVGKVYCQQKQLFEIAKLKNLKG